MLFKRISLKFKILLVLLLFTLVALGGFAYVAIKDFENDKVAYVFDSSLSQTKAVANLVSTELNSASNIMQYYLRGLDYQLGKFHSSTSSSLIHDDRILGLTVFRFGSNSNWIRSDQVGVSQSNSDVLGLLHSAYQNKVSVNLQSNSWQMAMRLDNISPYVIVADMPSSRFNEVLLVSEIYDVFLSTGANQVISQPMETIFDIDRVSLQSILADSQEQTSGQIGAFEYKGSDEISYLISYASIPGTLLRVYALIPKKVATETSQLVVFKLGLILGLLVCTILFFSILSAKSMSMNLVKLTGATRAVASGEFDVDLSIDSKDEVGELAKSFESMAGQIKNLLEDVKEKGRMEAELQTAKTVQARLFPNTHFKGSCFSFEGFYEPASECSGDWWHYQIIHNKAYFWIADATGHGVPAALVTAAAKSASSLLETMNEVPLPTIMSLMNKAVISTGKGEVNMTLTLARLDLQTLELTYSQASHVPPVLFPVAGRPLELQQLKFLDANNGPRLGQKADARFQESKLTLQPGDRVFFLTDGVLELSSAEGKMYGEKKLFKLLVQNFNDNVGLKPTVDKLTSDILKFSHGVHNEDDLTYFAIDIEPPAVPLEKTG